MFFLNDICMLMKVMEEVLGVMHEWTFFGSLMGKKIDKKT